MIELTPEIKQDLSSNVNNFDLLVHINSSGQNYYLGTRSATIDGKYYDDVITKISGAKESIDFRKKKIKLSGSSITINNAEINGKRFSDKIRGEMFGGVVEIYIKTQSCTELSHCEIISSLQITGVTHDNSLITLKCEDQHIDEFHKELPLAEHTLYENVNTFIGDNERRIPILYGHLRQAPAVVYIENMDTQSVFVDGNILVVPDRAFQDDYDIVGIKPISPFAETDSPPNQLIEQDNLSLKLGDSAANVYSQPPDRLHRELVRGNSLESYEFSTEWKTQFTVSENKDYINLFTASDTDASSNISNGNLLCGEVSKLIGAKTYKVKVYRSDEHDHDMVHTDTGESVDYAIGHYTALDTFLDSTDPSPENFDMLSLPAFHLNDTDEATNYTTEFDNGMRVAHNTENYVLADMENVGEWMWGSHLNFDIPIFELEFEALKASADQAKGGEDSYSDANIIGSFHHKTKTISNNDMNADEVERWFYNFYPSQGNQESEDSHPMTWYPDGDLTDPQLIDMSVNVLGVPPAAYNGVNTEWYNFDNWYEHYLDEAPMTIYHFTRHLDLTADIRTQAHLKRTVNATVSDYRHTFHTTEQLKDYEQYTNTWRNWYKLVQRTNYLSQNIYTGMAFPDFKEAAYEWGSEQQSIETALNTRFNGMVLKRSWYQKEVFNENFFVNAKGKYTTMTNNYTFPDESNDGFPQIMYGENLTLTFSSNAIDTADDIAARENPDHALFQLIDYLTKDRFEKHYENGKEYELVVTGEYTYQLDTGGVDDTSQNLIFFDVDILDFRMNLTDMETYMLYQFIFNSKIFRLDPVPSGDPYFWEASGWEFDMIQNIKLRYARRNIDSSGRITSWTFLEDEGVSSPFSIINDGGEVATQQLIEFENDETNNKWVSMIFSLDPYEEGADHTDPVIYTSEEYVKELISKPSDVVEDIVSRELGLSSDIVKKNIFDSNYKLDFSVDKTEEGIDVMQKIAECSPFFYKNQLSSGKASIVGIKHSYDMSNVDKRINVNQIFKYKFTKTKKEDVALKCRVKYGYDYVAEEYKKVTPDVEHSDPAEYINYYDIKDEESFVLEHEAPYIQDKVTAEVLAKHLFEINKNQHLNISFQIPLGDALALEVGDIISFVDNNGYRTNIDGVKPFGHTIKSIIFLNGQAVFPFFMITSIGKDLTKADIVVTQLHELTPSEYEDVTIGDWAELVPDPITGEMVEPPPTNAEPTIEIWAGTGLDNPTTELSGGAIIWIALDTDGLLLGYQLQIKNEDTGDIIHSFEDNSTIFDTPVVNTGVMTEDLPTLAEYGSYRFTIMVYDDNGAIGQDSYVGQFIEYTPDPPIASFTMFYDGTPTSGIEFFDGDEIPVTDYIGVNAFYSSSFEGDDYNDANIAQYHWSRVSNGVPLPDVVQSYFAVAWSPSYGIIWEGECSVTLVVTDSEGQESEPVTVSWFGEEEVEEEDEALNNTIVDFDTDSYNILDHELIDNETEPINIYEDMITNFSTGFSRFDIHYVGGADVNGVYIRCFTMNGVEYWSNWINISGVNTLNFASMNLFASSSSSYGTDGEEEFYFIIEPYPGGPNSTMIEGYVRRINFLWMTDSSEDRDR